MFKNVSVKFEKIGLLSVCWIIAGVASGFVFNDMAAMLGCFILSKLEQK